MKRILGIDFFQGEPLEAAARTIAGGLTVAPAAPGLCRLDLDHAYRRSLEAADLVIVDSGFLVLCWKWKTGERLSRLSGLRLVETLLAYDAFYATTPQLWVMPTAASIERCQAYLGSMGMSAKQLFFYEAPMYPAGNIQDQALLELILKLRPKLVVLNIAGGKQEILGAWLKQQLDYLPGILCTGAAIAFKTGEQVRIPTWGDRLFLGWFLRILSRPKLYFPRYWEALRLWKLVRQFGEYSPQPENHV